MGSMSDNDKSVEPAKYPILISFCPMVIGGFAHFVCNFVAAIRQFNKKNRMINRNVPRSRRRCFHEGGLRRSTKEYEKKIT